MSLIPYNETKKNQLFADLIDAKSVVDYVDLNIHPLTCNISLLPHIALREGANINGMFESEARLYLNTFSKENTGTIGAVEDAVNVHFKDAQVIEWFEDKENLAKGMFRIDVNTKADNSVIYDDRLFSSSTRLINSSKNVRSKLDFVNLKLSQKEMNIKNSGGAVINIKLKNELAFNSELQINLKGGIIWTI